MACLQRDGYAISELVLTATACETIASALPNAEARRGGVRNVLDESIVQRLLGDPRFAAAIYAVVDGPLVAVKATLFDKTPESNWRVQWHQDRAIAVRERKEVPGFGMWSVKAGVTHVEPPADVLAQMIAVRVHLDQSGPENGPLRVIPGSHRGGKLSDEQIHDLVRTQPHVTLAVPQGAVMLMRPLLLHASSPSMYAAHRRVLHVELAPEQIITPLRWAFTSTLGSR